MCLTLWLQNAEAGEQPLYFPLGEIVRFEVKRNSGGGMECAVRRANGSVTTLGSVASIGSGTMSIAANNSMRATLHSAILYGR